MLIRWSVEKNIWLKHVRWIWFEDILDAIDALWLLHILDHHNTIDYKWQKILIVIVRHYTYQVPCIITENELYMKTIFPSRKYKKSLWTRVFW